MSAGGAASDEARLGSPGILRLYHLPLCPFSRKIRIALREKGLAAELVEVQPWAHPEDFLALNPAGEAPVLEDEGASPATARRSPTISRRPTRDQPLGRTLGERSETRRLVAWFDSKFDREVTELLWREKLVKRWKRRDSRARRRCATASRNIRTHLTYIAGSTRPANGWPATS